MSSNCKKKEKKEKKSSFFIFKASDERNRILYTNFGFFNSRHSGGIGTLSDIIVIIKICITFFDYYDVHFYIIQILYNHTGHADTCLYYIVNNRTQGLEWPSAI